VRRRPVLRRPSRRAPERPQAPAPGQEQERRPGGPDVLEATVYGDGIPALERAALEQARELYGESAELKVERVGTIQTWSTGKGAFTACIRVRCLNFPGLSLPDKAPAAALPDPLVVAAIHEAGRLLDGYEKAEAAGLLEEGQ